MHSTGMLLLWTGLSAMVAAIPFDPPVSEGVKNAPALRKLEARQLGVLDRMFSLAGRDRSQRREGVLWLKSASGVGCYTMGCAAQYGYPGLGAVIPKFCAHPDYTPVANGHCQPKDGATSSQSRQEPYKNANQGGLGRGGVFKTIQDVQGAVGDALPKSYPDNSELACYETGCERDPNDSWKCRRDHRNTKYVMGVGGNLPYCQEIAPTRRRQKRSINQDKQAEKGMWKVMENLGNAVQDMVQKSYPDNTYLACYATKCKRDRNNPSKCQQDPRIVEYVPSDGVNYPYCKEVSPTQGRQNPSSTNNRKGLQRREVKLSTGALRNIAGGARRNLKKLSYADNTHLACYSKECIRDPNDARKCRLDPGIMEYVGGDGVTPPYCKFPAPLQKREDPNTTDKGKRLQRRQVKPTLGDRWNNAGRALGNINKLSYPDDKAKGCYQIGCQRDRNNPGRCRAFSGILEYVPSKGGRSSYCKEVPPLTLHRDGSVTGGGTEQNR